MNKSNTEKASFNRPLVLIGMMGAGKTSVGRALADIIHTDFFDSDAEIEAISGRSVANIFLDYGENEFRRIERQVIARLLESGPCVLSLGGGAFIDEETRLRIKDKALSVWLKVDHALLIKRILRHDHRPLLKGDNPQEKMKNLLSAREPVYAKADLTIVCDDRPVALTARQVWETVRAHMV